MAGGKNPILERLQHHPFLVLDGALATELEARGASLQDRLWSARILLERPELIAEMHADYFAAGADIAITASYQATHRGFSAAGIDHDRANRILRRSVALAAHARAPFLHDATRPQPLLAASIGPYAAYLADGSEYHGRYTVSHAELMAFHRPRVEILAATGVDLLACETIPCHVEALALCDLLHILDRVTPRLPAAWMTFACRNGRELNSGESFAAAIRAVAGRPQVAAVGVNCTPPVYVEELVRTARGITAKPIVVYPNRGERWDARTRAWVEDPDAPCLADFVDAWLAAGANVIGGCCRTGPADIRPVAARRDAGAGHPS